ncbi:MAG: phenylacetate-CoA oxygenase/reductase subunit PaaK [Aureispira sp.]|nr:phenylacetate-CoA oxygenase/reductase subunit PaaK [Aureispira sp.]
MTPKFHKLTVKDVRKETDDCTSVAFEVPTEHQDDYQFIQGQYLTLRTDINGEDIRRSYSICSSPLDSELRVAIKKIDGGKFSTFANDSLKRGDELEVMTPTGNFYTELNADNKKQYIAFAAGSGITPIMSIMKTVLQTEPNSEFTLLYGNKNTASIIFKEEIEALKNKYLDRFSVHYFLSRERLETPLLNGRITGEKCETLFDKLIDVKKADEFFLCGPEKMIFEVRDALSAVGVEEDHVHFELFTSPDGKLGGDSKSVEVNEDLKGKSSAVTVKLDGITFDMDVPFEGETVLDAALKEGADLPFACKGGVCCTCKAKLLEGEVTMAKNYALEQDELDKGFILTCQAYPTTEKVVVDFDEI